MSLITDSDQTVSAVYSCNNWIYMYQSAGDWLASYDSIHYLLVHKKSNPTLILSSSPLK